MESSAFLPVLAAVAGVGIFFSIIGIAVYVLSSLALFTIAKNRGFQNPGLAWIPGVGMAWVIGKCVGSLRIFNIDVPRLDLVLPLGGLIIMGISWIPLLGWLASIAYAILSIYALYLFFMQYRPASATMYTVLCAIPVTSFVCTPLFLMMIRNDQYIG